MESIFAQLQNNVLDRQRWGRPRATTHRHRHLDRTHLPPPPDRPRTVDPDRIRNNHDHTGRSGREDNSAIDRWMARVQLHTDDPAFAEKMRSATKTEKGVNNNYGYHRLEASIRRISREPEFAGYPATQLQAMPWVHLVGPDGVLGDIQDLSSDAAATAEAKRHTEAMRWKDPA